MPCVVDGQNSGLVNSTLAIYLWFGTWGLGLGVWDLGFGM